MVSTGGGVPLNTTLPDTLPAVAASTVLPGVDVADGGGLSLPPHAATRPNDDEDEGRDDSGEPSELCGHQSYRANQAETTRPHKL